MSEKMEIPKGWEWVKLGNVCEKVVGGGTPTTKKPEYWQGDIPWITSADINGLKDIRVRKYISQDAILDSATNLLPRGGIVVVTRVGLGKIALIDCDLCFSQDSQGLIVNQNQITTGYALWCLSDTVQIFKFNNQGTTISGVTKKQLIDLQIPLPPLPEQHRIVAKIEALFSSLDKGIESLKTAQQQLKVYRQAVLKWAFEGKLTNENVKDVELPAGWKWVKLGDVVDDFVRGPFGSSLKKEFFVLKGYKVYEQKNAIYQSVELGKYFIDENKFQELKRFEVNPDDYIVSCSGTIGKLYKIPNNSPKGLINQALLIIKIKRSVISDKFFSFLFTATFFQRLIIKDAKGTAMLNLAGVKEMRIIPISLPSLPEQHAIVSEIESRLSVCDKLEESIIHSLKQAEALRQSVLKKAFSGKLVPQDPNDAPASVLLERIKAEKEKNMPDKKVKVKKVKN